jgi:hypothetical protein
LLKVNERALLPKVLSEEIPPLMEPVSSSVGPDPTLPTASEGVAIGALEETAELDLIELELRTVEDDLTAELDAFDDDLALDLEVVLGATNLAGGGVGVGFGVAFLVVFLGGGGGGSSPPSPSAYSQVAVKTP